MTQQLMNMDPRYPVGRLEKGPPLAAAERASMIDTVASLPRSIRAAVHGLSDAQLDTPYRDGGWTVRQVVHHVADSHMNAAVRFRLALTEESPTIRPYDEGAWAELPDARTLALAPSLQLLEGLHARWVHLLRGMTDGQYARTLIHPVNGQLSLSDMLRVYEWHCRHHVAHITRLRERMRW